MKPESEPLVALQKSIVACAACPRLRAHGERVTLEKKRAFRDWDYWGLPVPGFGDPRARLLIVGLAPAAHGANRTGRMFTGDSSGDWLYEALHRFGFANQPTSVARDDGLALADCWITAAAHCAPPDNKPTPAELDHCQAWLERELPLLPRTELVVTLGRIAHERWLRASGAWSRLSARERPAFGHGRETVLGPAMRAEVPGDRAREPLTLISSYHPSRQNTNTGRLTRPMWHGVFARARALLGA